MSHRQTTATACAAALLLALTLSACASSSAPSSGAQGSPTGTSSTALPSGSSHAPSPPGTYTTPPPVIPVPGSGVTMSTAAAQWPAPVLIGNGSLSAAYVLAAGLPYAGEMLHVHYHAHLDVIVDGHKVPVPAYLGFVLVHGKVGLAPLHTHDASGVIHIENKVQATFVLGQFFALWGVRFSATCLGGYCAGNGNDLVVFVNGQRYAGDPTRLPLHKHDEVAVIFGPSANLPKPPSSYHFSGGL